MDADRSVAIYAAKMIADGTDLIDSAGDGFSSNLKGFNHFDGKPSEFSEKAEFVFGACAGAAIYRRKMIEEIVFLDEDFFLIYEDTDLNFRAQLRRLEGEICSKLSGLSQSPVHYRAHV